MKTKSTILITALAITIVCVIISMMAVKRQQAALETARQKTPLGQRARELAPKASAASVQLAEGNISPADNSPQIESVKPDANVKTQKATAANQAAIGQDPGPEDPLAREALSFVGEDPEADAYWVAAINDPSLSDNERQNLIEDLNEDGLSDPRHPGPQDLPLIWSRLRLIEMLAPDAMDQVNADAFQEAYKDLVNLEQLAMGRGTPVN